MRARIDQVQHNTLVPQVLRPVWQRWLALEILAGRIDAAADTPCDWIMPRPQQVAPAKDLEATEKALALGPTSRTNAINELVKLLTGNPAMSDGTPVFDASRGNAGTAGAPFEAAVVGVFELPKTAGAIGAGAKVYWKADTANMTTTATS